MPLTRFNVTDYSRHMIPLFPMFAAGIGIGWIVMRAEILSNTPVYELLLRFAPNYAWGFLWIAVAYVLVHAVLTESRKLFLWGLRLLIALSVAWSVAGFIAVFTSDGTISAWMWGAFVAFTANVQRKTLKLKESDPLFDPTYTPRA